MQELLTVSEVAQLMKVTPIQYFRMKLHLYLPVYVLAGKVGYVNNETRFFSRCQII